MKEEDGKTEGDGLPVSSLAEVWTSRMTHRSIASASSTIVSPEEPVIDATAGEGATLPYPHCVRRGRPDGSLHDFPRVILPRNRVRPVDD